MYPLLASLRDLCSSHLASLRLMYPHLTSLRDCFMYPHLTSLRDCFMYPHLASLRLFYVLSFNQFKRLFYIDNCLYIAVETNYLLQTFTLVFKQI